ncbi:MAG: hypothetical protein MZW92_17475 [Comamonadaceae bacterium]|nr:hypothetical protein [Comamonadaceae bacterium]
MHYLGPVIVAERDRPVRIKFTNKLPAGAAGNLFIPVDESVMGAGTGPANAGAQSVDDAGDSLRQHRSRGTPAPSSPRTAPPSTCMAAALPGSATALPTSGSPRWKKSLPSPRVSACRMSPTCPTRATARPPITTPTSRAPG